MKKYYKYVLIITCILLCACNESKNFPITDSNMFPSIDKIARFAIYDNPLDSNDLVLGLCSWGEPDPNDSLILRDCFTNELISCSDSTGKLKEFVILFLGEDTNWENVRMENPIYEVDGDEYYVKIYLSKSKEIDYWEQRRNDTLEININERKHGPHVYLENKRQEVENFRYPSYRLLGAFID